MRFLTILVIITIIAIWINRFFFGEEDNKKSINKNINKSIESNYKEYWNPYFADVWVAFSVNIWTKINKISWKWWEIYSNLMDLEYMMSHKNITKNEIIFKNIELLNEYISLLETNFAELLDSSPDRLEVFDTYMSQLLYKWKQIKQHISNLKKQQNLLKKVVDDTARKLANLKISIKNSLKDLNKYWATDWIDKYLDLKLKYNFWKTYLYLITKFIDNFEKLQDYNRNLIKELRKYKPLIVSWDTVVVPKADKKILEKYWLLIDDIK